METKVCNGCGVDKPLSEYYKETRGKYGVRGVCKSCYILRLKRYRQTEHGREARRRVLSKYFKTDKGKIVNKRRKHTRRAKLKDAGTYTNEEWKDRLLEYNHCCAYCYKPFPVEELTIDHMIPLSRGGTNTIDNIVPACKPCNSRKKNKTPLEMLQKGLM
jgi:5-methylcytosine-specific restriction endonuclease McrA